MKKLSFIIAALLVCGSMQAQILFDFEDGTLQGWTTIDADGDGHNWQQQSASGLGHSDSDGVVLSYSVDPSSGNPLTPDNYIVSPRLSISNPEESIILFYARNLDENYSEVFMTAISTTVNDDPLAFTDIHSWSVYSLGGWTEYVLDLTDYAGQEVYIAFHHNLAKHSAICIDGECVGVVEEAESIGVYPNPTNGLVRINGVKVAELQVCNLLGQLVKTDQNTNEIDLKGLPEGVYLLRITDEIGAVATRKIIVQ